MRKKLKNTSGLTFVEMLCATGILFLLVLMMSTGMQMALASYRTHTGDAETQLLLNSLTGALSDKLRYCVVTVDTGGTYKSCSVGEVSVNAAGHVTVGGKELLSAGAYGEKGTDSKRRYQVTEASVTGPGAYTVGIQPVFTVTLKVKDTQTGISKETTLTVRCLNPVKKEGTSP